MAKNVENAPEPVVLIIADISGYTNYMTANAKTLAHGQALITELVKTILKQVELPLKVAKLEGDAVFLFARKEETPVWRESSKLLGEKLFRLFAGFSSKVNELSSATTCTCDACSHVQKLRLKVVVHSGEALFHKVMQFEELAGVDVIIVHRLLKNSLKANQYLLLTKKAQEDIELPGAAQLARGREMCEGIGEIEVGVYYPEETMARGLVATPGGFFARFGKSWQLFLKLWFRGITPAPEGDTGKFNNVTTNASRPGRIMFAALTVALTPIYLVVGAVFVLVHVLRGQGANRVVPKSAHVHNADGSCCGVEKN